MYIIIIIYLLNYLIYLYLDRLFNESGFTYQIPGIHFRHVSSYRKSDTVTTVDAPIEYRHYKTTLLLGKPIGQEPRRQRIASSLPT